jgi:hypothetical protein
MSRSSVSSQLGFGWSRKEQVKKLASARSQIMRVRPIDYVNEDGLTTSQIKAEIEAFSQRLHEWAATPEGQAACEAEWDSYWRSENAN